MYLLLIFFVVLLSITEVYEKLIPEIYFNNLVMAYSPLGKPDSPWAMEDEPKLLEDPKLVEIGKKYDKTPAQICLKWQTQRGVAVVPRSVNPSRIAQNADVRIPVRLSYTRCIYVVPNISACLKSALTCPLIRPVRFRKLY